MDGVKVEAGQPGASEVLDAEYDTVIDYLQHYEAAHGVKLPVRYDLCVCASKGRAGHEATEVADWIGYLPEHGDEHKDAYQLAHPVTAISDDGSAVTPSILEQVFENVKESGLYLIEHCEHHDTGAVNDGPVSRKLGVPGIPEDTELKIVERDIDMSPQNRRARALPARQHRDLLRRHPQSQGRRTSDHLRDRAALHRIERRGAA